MDSTARIRELNDAFRTGFARDGRVYVTAGIAAMSPEQQVEVMRRVHCFIAFTPDNDPYGEHDFGSFEYAGKTIFWKVDCYDRDLNYGSPDSADENVTTRVMTVIEPPPPDTASPRCRVRAASLPAASVELSWRFLLGGPRLTTSGKKIGRWRGPPQNAPCVLARQPALSQWASRSVCGVFSRSGLRQ